MNFFLLIYAGGGTVYSSRLAGGIGMRCFHEPWTWAFLGGLLVPKRIIAAVQLLASSVVIISLSKKTACHAWHTTLLALHLLSS